MVEYVLRKGNEVVAYSFSLEKIKKEGYKRLKKARGGTVFFIDKTIGDIHKTLKHPNIDQRVIFNKY